MQYRTHVTTTLAITLPLMVATNTLSFVSLGAVALGTVFPDIDEPHSWIGARTRGISDLIHTFFGHRGITHSLVGLTLAFLTVLLMTTLTSFNLMTGLFFVFGYGLHLIEDSFSKSGVKWLLPLTNKNYQFGNGFYYTTGGLIENFILLGAVIILLIEFKTLNLVNANLFDFNIPTIISELFIKVQTLSEKIIKH